MNDIIKNGTKSGDLKPFRDFNESEGLKPLQELNEIKDIPADELLYDLADVFKIFGDSTRLKILFALFGGEMCVCDIAESLDMSQSAISHQLRVLKQSKLVKFRRDGKSILYSLDDAHVSTIIAQGLNHIEE